jgi:hypothetical protein
MSRVVRTQATYHNSARLYTNTSERNDINLNGETFTAGVAQASCRCWWPLPTRVVSDVSGAKLLIRADRLALIALKRRLRDLLTLVEEIVVHAQRPLGGRMGGEKVHLAWSSWWMGRTITANKQKSLETCRLEWLMTFSYATRWTQARLANRALRDRTELTTATNRNLATCLGGGSFWPMSGRKCG